MNRELKFRACIIDKDLSIPKQIIYPHVDDFIKDNDGMVCGQVRFDFAYGKGMQMYICLVEGERFDNKLGNVADYEYDNPNYYIQQYTGISDRHMVEIYEGDITTLWIGNESVSSGTFEVIFDRGAFCLSAITINGSAGVFFPSGVNYLTRYDENPAPKVTPLYNFNSSLLEVIGNKFENPELCGNL